MIYFTCTTDNGTTGVIVVSTGKQQKNISGKAHLSTLHVYGNKHEVQSVKYDKYIREMISDLQMYDNSLIKTKESDRKSVLY